MKRYALILSAGVLAASTALMSLPASACDSFVAAETHGAYNQTALQVRRCAQIGVFQDGYDNSTQARVHGRSRAALSQIGDWNELDVDVGGYDNDVGVSQSGGSRVTAQVRGRRNGAAVYSGGGTAHLAIHGHDNEVVIDADR